MKVTAVLECLGHPKTTNVPEKDPIHMLRDLAGSWFSSARSIKTMMRGTVNKTDVFKSVSKKSFVLELFACGMVSREDHGWLECYPDGVATLDTDILKLTNN